MDETIKRRKRGEGSVSQINQKLRAEGKSYVNNKKVIEPQKQPPPHQVRQNYIRRRLLTTYKALERLSQSEFNLDRLEVTPATAAAVQAQSQAQAQGQAGGEGSAAAAQEALASPPPAVPQLLAVPGASTSAAVLRVVKQRATTNLPLTIRDVERERGKPLSKYERNMMIFNWLHTLDDSAFEGLQ